MSLSLLPPPPVDPVDEAMTQLAAAIDAVQTLALWQMSDGLLGNSWSRPAGSSHGWSPLRARRWARQPVADCHREPEPRPA